MPSGQDGASAPSALNELRSRIATGNARPVLTEILTALDALLATGRNTVIDLGAVPFAPGDERLLDEVLGVGEVRATLDVLGESIVQETAISGVWRIDHFDQRGDTLSRFIEITFTPEILKTQHADAQAGRARLEARLADVDGRSR